MQINLSSLILLGLLLTVGFAFGKVAERLKFPKIVGYILAGALFSQSVLGPYLVFPEDPTQPWWPQVATEVALMVIAFLIGADIDLDDLKKEEKTVVFGALGQSLVTLAVLGAGIWAYFTFFDMGDGIVLALTLGAIGTATAPAGTLAVIEEKKARGPLTSAIIGIVALDDILGIILFTLVIGLVGESGIYHSLAGAGEELLGSVVLGGVMALFLGKAARKYGKLEANLALILGFIILALGLSSYFGFSYLLAGMTLGFLSKRFARASADCWEANLAPIKEFIFLLFFTVAGSNFKFSVIWNSAGLVAAFIVLRFAGKMAGAWLGTRLAGAEPQVRKNLGLALMPQAGVAIALALMAKNTKGLEQYGELILNTVLGATIFFAVLAPFLTSKALDNAGEGGQ